MKPKNIHLIIVTPPESERNISCDGLSCAVLRVVRDGKYLKGVKNACEVLFTFSKPETGSRMRQEWAEKVPESI